MPSMNNVQRLARDVQAAIACFTALKSLTPSVRKGITQWFPDVEVEEIYPLPVLELSLEERTLILGQILNEMGEAMLATLEQRLGDEEAFPKLAPVLDPLYREFYSLHATDLNAEWEDSRPRSEDELIERLVALQAVTGMELEDLRERASNDRRLLALVCRFGMTIEDLDHEF